MTFKSKRWQIINGIQPHLWSPHNPAPLFWHCLKVGRVLSDLCNVFSLALSPRRSFECASASVLRHVCLIYVFLWCSVCIMCVQYVHVCSLFVCSLTALSVKSVHRVFTHCTVRRVCSICAPCVQYVHVCSLFVCSLTALCSICAPCVPGKQEKIM